MGFTGQKCPCWWSMDKARSHVELLLSIVQEANPTAEAVLFAAQMHKATTLKDCKSLEKLLEPQRLPFKIAWPWKFASTLYAIFNSWGPSERQTQAEKHDSQPPNQFPNLELSNPQRSIQKHRNFQRLLCTGSQGRGCEEGGISQKPRSRFAKDLGVWSLVIFNLSIESNSKWSPRRSPQKPPSTFPPFPMTLWSLLLAGTLEKGETGTLSRLAPSNVIYINCILCLQSTIWCCSQKSSFKAPRGCDASSFWSGGCARAWHQYFLACPPNLWLLHPTNLPRSCIPNLPCVQHTPPGFEFCYKLHTSFMIAHSLLWKLSLIKLEFCRTNVSEVYSTSRGAKRFQAPLL